MSVSLPRVRNELDDLNELVDRIFSEQLNPHAVPLRYELDRSLWSVLCDAGLTRLTLAERDGGSGAGLSEATVLLAQAARHAVPLPLAESDLLAGWMLGTARIPVATGPMTVGLEILQLERSPRGLTARGTLTRVPWSKSCDFVVCLGQLDNETFVIALPPHRLVLEPGFNVAGEPRDTVRVDVRLGTSDVAGATGDLHDEVLLRGALARAIGLAACSQRAVELALKHVLEREQFGRPLSRMQTIQHQVADAASEAATAQAAVAAAVQAASRQGFPEAVFAIAVAKSRSSAAAGRVARIVHQLHGAIGFTLEHQLRLSTTRLWAWREEFGSERHWDTVIAKQAMDVGPTGLWPLLAAGVSTQAGSGLS